jgi:hypothetical protein
MVFSNSRNFSKFITVASKTLFTTPYHEAFNPRRAAHSVIISWLNRWFKLNEIFEYIYF